MTTATDQAVPVKVWIKSDGVENERPFDAAELSRENILTVVSEANDLVERENEVEIVIRFRLPNGRFTKARLGLRTVVEPHEIFAFSDAPEPIVKWAESFGFTEPEKEPELNPGESFVHLTISDERDGIIGRVTAMLATIDDDKYEVAFAFCDKAETFSRRTGRMIARERMEREETAVLRRFTSYSRFDTIKTTIQEYMTHGKSCMVYPGEHDNVSMPRWLQPRPHPDIPKPVQEVLRKIAFGNPIEGTDRSIAFEYLGLSGEYQTKFVMHEDELNKFDQAAMTFEVG